MCTASGPSAPFARALARVLFPAAGGPVTMTIDPLITAFYLPREAAGGGPVAEERLVEGASHRGVPAACRLQRPTCQFFHVRLAPSTTRSSLRSARGPPPAATRGR